MTPLGTFGAPPDAASWAALCAGVVALGWAMRRRTRSLPPHEWLVPLLAVGAFALSWGYVLYYLRGGPRIIDATSYFLEARTFASGSFSFPFFGPSGSFRGRFLLAAPDLAGASVIFPPGYPALLALGFLAGNPLLVGPVIGGLLVIATYRLGVQLFDDRRVALIAAVLSALSATLRYHTADTMSHGWAALLGATVVLGALGRGASSAAFAGLAAGWLFATRPVTGVVFALVALVLLRGRIGQSALFVAVSLCGPLLVSAHQLAATGDAGQSTQLAYYALADGPPGCFRYGFGADIGCEVEHGDFVRHNLPDGYGALQAAGTTLRRLKMHLLDAGNVELLFFVAVWAAWRGRRHRGVRLATSTVAAVMVAYVPFYFDGNYPGGGARFYVDALPFEQLLVAWGLVHLGVARFTLAAVLVGFALHGSYEHRQLAGREGGRPMFEPSVVARAGVTTGLLLVDTDHGFNLGHRPGALDLVVARRRGDAHDTQLWEQLGRPPAYHYRYEPGDAASVPRVVPHVVVDSPRWEAEAEWPPVAVSAGFVRPHFEGCASGGRALELVAHGPAAPATTLAIATRQPGSHRLALGWVHLGGGERRVEVAVSGRRWIIPIPGGGRCGRTALGELELPAGRHRVSIRASSGVAVDYVDVVAAS